MLHKPIIVNRGETRGIYVHSETREGRRQHGPGQCRRVRAGAKARADVSVNVDMSRYPNP